MLHPVLTPKHIAPNEKKTGINQLQRHEWGLINNDFAIEQRLRDKM